MDDSNQSSDLDEVNEYYESTGQFYGPVKDVVVRYTHCSLCGAHLHFTYHTDFSQNLTQESAKCPECGVRVRQVVHKLQ